MNIIITMIFISIATTTIIFTIYDLKERRKEYRKETKIGSEVYRKK